MTTRNFNVKNGLTAGTITLDTATGNATANYFIGNGSALTGITASQITGVTSIANGTTSVSIPVAAGNVIANVGGTANILVLSNLGANVTGTLTTTNISVSGAASGIVNVAATLGNLGIRSVAATYTDTAVTGTQANAAIHYIAQPTIGGGTNAKTYTNMATLFVANSPAATTNATITNSYAVFVAAGNSFFGGNILGTLANGNSNVRIATANGNVTIAAVGNTTMTITGTGANITGTANISGNANVGNLGTVGLIATGNANINLAAGNSLTVAATAPPTADMVLITNTGQNVATAGVSALQINYTGGAGAIEASAYRSDMTPGTTSGSIWNAYRVAATTAAASGVIFNGIKFDNKTAGAGTSRAFYVGTGYDDILNYNGTSVIYGNGVINGAQVGAASSIVNGTSNVNIPASGGNVNTSVGGTANVLVVTSTGANITGTLNVTGNATVGNLTTGGGTGGNITGANVISANTLILATSANIPIVQNGNSNVSIVANANINFGVTGTANVVSITAAGIITTAANAAISSNSFTATGAAFGNVNTAAALSNLGFRSVAATYTDTAVTGTQANAAIHYLAQPTIGGGTNAKTYTNIATLFIANAPAATTNATITNSYAMLVGAGNSLFNGNVTANFFIGNGSQLTGVTATTATQLANGTSNVNIPASGGNVNTSVGGTANVLVITTTGANVLGTITATGVITGTNIIANGANGTVIANNHTASGAATGNANVGGTVTGNLGIRAISSTYTDNSAAASAVIANAAIHGIGIPTLAAANLTVTSTNAASFFIEGPPTAGTNMTITNGYALHVESGNALFAGNILGTLANGNSNVRIATANGNVTLTAVGNTTMTITGTGANISGTANVSGNANVGNLGTATAIIATGNITTINSGLLQNGTSNVVVTAAGGNVNLGVAGTTRITATSTGANVTGTLGVSGNANVLNLGTAQVLATANVTAPQLISNIATGTAPLVVTSTTRVANLNVATAGVANTVNDASQSNITSVGTLTGLTVSGTITSTAATALSTTLTGTNSANLIYASMGDNDQFRILVGATATNAGFVEIATADDGTEPIYVRQYTGVFTTVARTATLLDGSGNTSFPGSVTANGDLLVGTGTAVQKLTIGSGSASSAGINLRTTQTDFTIIPSNSAAGGVSINTSWVSGGQGPLTFTNSGGETMRISGTGNVGIGNAAPAHKLSVTGTTSLVGNVTIQSNIAYVAPNGANTINSTMLNGGTLAWSGNAGQLFSIADSMTGNIFTVNDVSGIPMISVDAGGNIQFAVSGGFVNYGVTTGITAAGSTQGTATTLSRPINVVSTVSASTGVILPTVPAGARILVMNTSGTALSVYPPSGAAINSAATNAAYSQPAGARLEYISTSTTQWYTLNATYG